MSSIWEWSDIKRKRGTSINRLLCIFPEATLLECVKTLVDHRIHRVCVIQLALPNTVLCVLSHHRILKFLTKKCEALMTAKITIRDLGIGEYQALHTVTYETSMFKALNVLIRHGLSSVPIVNKDGMHPSQPALLF